MAWVAGINRCELGWFVILREIDSRRTAHRVIRSFGDIMTFPENSSVVATGCPIGLLDSAVPGGRECDQIARALLGSARASSVFPIPVRAALSGRDYEEACAINAASSPFHLRLARQTFGLFPMLREVDTFMTPERQKIIVEAHRELCFYELNGAYPIQEAKKTRPGRDARRRILADAKLIPPGDSARPEFISIEEMLDTYAVCWTAERIASGTAKRIPEKPRVDSKGLRMEMWR